MGWRELTEKHPRVSAAVAVVVIAAALAAISLRGRGASVATGGQYFFDLASGNIFVGPRDAISPIDTPEGGKAVLAHVFSCGACTESQWRVLYLESLTEEARQVRLASQKAPSDDLAAPSINQPMDRVASGIRIAAPPQPGQTPQWVPQGHQSATALETAFLTLCNGQRATRCIP